MLLESREVNWLTFSLSVWFPFWILIFHLRVNFQLRITELEIKLHHFFHNQKQNVPLSFLMLQAKNTGICKTCHLTLVLFDLECNFRALLTTTATKSYSLFISLSLEWLFIMFISTFHDTIFHNFPLSCG